MGNTITSNKLIGVGTNNNTYTCTGAYVYAYKSRAYYVYTNNNVTYSTYIIYIRADHAYTLCMYVLISGTFLRTLVAVVCRSVLK